MNGLQMFHVGFDFFIIGILDTEKQNEFEFEIKLNFFVFENFPDLINHAASVLLANQILLDPTHFEENAFFDLLRDLA